MTEEIVGSNGRIVDPAVSTITELTLGAPKTA